jgi:Regulator of chromosome condensation (RCC1) repeat
MLKLPQVACGSYHTLALTEDRHVYSWCSSLLGQVTLLQFCPDLVHHNLMSCPIEMSWLIL